MSKILYLLLVIAIVVAGTSSTPSGAAQEKQDTVLSRVVPELLRVHGPDPDLVGIRDAAFSGQVLAVLARPSPAVFVFEPEGNTRKWGNLGEGPAELADPQSIVWVHGDLLIFDFDLGKIASFDVEGLLRSTRPISGLVGGLAYSAGDTLITRFTFAGARSAVRLRSSEEVKLLTMPPPPTVVLSAVGSPPLRMPPPYTGVGTWASLPCGGIVHWDGASDHLATFDLLGRAGETLPLPEDQYPVSAEDRRAWMASAVPSGDLAGRGDVFAALRGKVEGQVEFPSHFPVVLGLMGDPHGGAWVKRTPDPSIWTYVDGEGPQLTIRLPADRKLMAVSASELAARSRDSMGVESIEVYRNPMESAAPCLP